MNINQWPTEERPRERLLKLGASNLSNAELLAIFLRTGIVGKTALSIEVSDALLKEGFFVTGFGFPVVPEGTARIRVQISDALSYGDMEKALDAFTKVGKEFNLI